MKEYTKLIALITVTSFLVIAVGGYYVFHQMNASLLKQHEEQFRSESVTRIKIFKEHIRHITDNFQAYSQLPSFRSIRFYTLTLNQLAVEDNIRQLELFFLDIQKNNNYLEQIRFIDNDGNEIIKVDKNAIQYNLANISQYSNVIHLLEHNLEHDAVHIDVIRNVSGEPITLVWWIPVYVSSNKRLGYLAFDVNISLIQLEMTGSSDTGLNIVAITSDTDNFLKGDYQLISEPLPDGVLLQDSDWVISDDLPLSGLDWRIHIIGNKQLHLEGINTVQSAVNFGLIPSVALILTFLLYIYRKKIEADKHIHHLAYYDSLTGLVNRHQFDNALNNALSETSEHDTHHALLYLDLDQFKVVNDTCGHMAGDKLLEELAAHLKHSVRDSDMLARLGGDEFALLLNACPEEKAITIANKMLSNISDFHFVWKDKSFSIGASIGVVYIDAPDDSASNILRKADLACYMAKELGRNRIHIYTEDDQYLEERHGEMQWVSRIKRALEKDDFFLEAQRIMPLDDEVHSYQRYEILIRLNDNNKTIPPDAFIPAAERYGIMPNIDKWVIEHSFAFMQKLRASPAELNKNIIFSINVSGLTLGEKNFFSFIKEKFTQYKIPPESICFEITETAAISNLSIALEFMNSIKTLGCSLALDDFGSGLCSFTYLKTIPVDYLKIDGAFVTQILDNPLDMAIVMAVKQISIATGTKVIAEFVSSNEIKIRLEELGIDYAQGYSVAKPVAINQLYKLVDVNTLNQPAVND